MSGMKGKCLHMLHIFQDRLFDWGTGMSGENIQMPLIPSIEVTSKEDDEEKEEPTESGDFNF